MTVIGLTSPRRILYVSDQRMKENIAAVSTAQQPSAVVLSLDHGETAFVGGKEVDIVIRDLRGLQSVLDYEALCS